MQIVDFNFQLKLTFNLGQDKLTYSFYNDNFKEINYWLLLFNRMKKDSINKRSEINENKKLAII